MPGPGLKNRRSISAGNPVVKFHAKRVQGRQIHSHEQFIVVPGWMLIAGMKFHHRKDEVSFLKARKRMTYAPKKMTASRFEDFQIPAVINMIAEGAFGVNDPVSVGKFFHSNRGETEFPLLDTGCRLNRELKRRLPRCAGDLTALSASYAPKTKSRPCCSAWRRRAGCGRWRERPFWDPSIS